LTAKFAVPLFPINSVFKLFFAGNYFRNNVVLVKKCIMCHFYTQDTVPVPAVIVVTLNPPDGPAVVPVRPEPMVIVNVSAYFKITTPEPPAPPPTKAVV
jgi:hypothetical protein